MTPALPWGETSVQGSVGDAAFEQPSNSKSTATIESCAQLLTRNSSKLQSQVAAVALSVPHESGGVMTGGFAVALQRWGHPACAGEAKSRATAHETEANQE